MATHVFHGFSPSAWVIEGGGPSVSVGSKMMVDPEWSASTDAYEFSVTDADASFEGDDLNDGVGNDSTQQVLVKDAGGATLYDAKGYLENSFTLDDGNGTVVTVYDVYVGTTYVGSIADGPITPGVSWGITSIDNVTGANAPDYTSVEDQDFEQGIANTMEGGAHNDSLLGGAGSDTLDVGGGTANSAAGDTGNDTIYGGTGSDTLLGESGEDEILGDGGNDSIDGGSGNDLLGGDAGDDTILGQGGLDTIYGGTGHDYIDGGTEDDSIEGGIGNDTVLGGEGSDTISGDAGNDSIEGGTGDDMLFGNEGDDTLFFGLGNDTVYGGDGNDSIDDAFGELTDVYSSYLDGGSGSDTIHAGGGSDTLIGGADNDQLWGEQGNDSLDGGAGSDELRGGAGDDTIVGGAGDDSLRSGDGYDTFKFSDDFGSDTIHDFDMGDDDSNGLTNDQFDVTTLLDSGALPVNFDDVVVSDDGSGNAVLTFSNGEAVTLIGVAPAQVDGRDEMHSIGIPCFADGTRILTPAGEVLVEELRAGDRIAQCITGFSRSFGLGGAACRRRI